MHKGQKTSEETKAKIRAAQIGKKFSPEHIAKLKFAHLGVPLSPEHSAAIRQGQLTSPLGRMRMAFWKGKRLSEEAKRKMSVARMGNQHTLGKKMPSSRENVIKLRKRGKYETRIEKKIKAILQLFVVVYEQEKYFEGVGLVDFYLPQYHLVIECDGDYWHNKPGAKENDIRRDETLNAMGIKVLRLPEKEINQNIESCIGRMKGAISWS